MRGKQKPGKGGSRTLAPLLFLQCPWTNKGQRLSSAFYLRSVDSYL